MNHVGSDLSYLVLQKRRREADLSTPALNEARQSLTQSLAGYVPVAHRFDTERLPDTRIDANGIVEPGYGHGV